MIFVNARFLTQKITGVQRYAIEISRRLKKIDPSISFIAPKNIIHHDLAVELGAQVIGRLSGCYWEQLELPFYISMKKGFLVNLSNVAPLFIKNQIFCIYDLSFIRHPECFSKSFARFYKFLIPKISKRSKGILTISEFSKKEIIDVLKIGESKIERVYCGVTESLIDEQAINNKYGKYILAVASLDPRKNFPRLIQAYNQLASNEIKLIVCGGLQGKVFKNQFLSDHFQSNKNVIYLGQVSDVELSALYSHALLFVYPSLYEGFGMPPLEAMANGCPVLVSAIPSLQEVCGDAAYYCDPYRIDDIAEKLELTVTHSELRKELAIKGLSRSQKFKWDTSAMQIHNYITKFSGR